MGGWRGVDGGMEGGGEEATPPAGVITGWGDSIPGMVDSGMGG